MDTLLVAAAIVIPLTVALAWAIWFLVAQYRTERQRRTPTRHVFKGQGEAVTVAELVEEATEQGEATRLNWSAEDEARASSQWRGTRPYAQNSMGTEVFPKPDEFPTEILPRVEEFGDD